MKLKNVLRDVFVPKANLKEMRPLYVYSFVALGFITYRALTENRQKPGLYGGLFNDPTIVSQTNNSQRIQSPTIYEILRRK